MLTFDFKGIWSMNKYAAQIRHNSSSNGVNARNSRFPR